MAVEVEPTFFARPLEERLHIVDTLAAIELSNRAATSSTAHGFPVPLLGYPGWVPQNAFEAYYDDVRYFRP